MAWNERDKERFREMFMAGTSYQELQSEFGIAYRTVKDMRARLGLPPRVKRDKQPPSIPNDWYAVAPNMFKKELQAYYAMSRLQIERLVETTGIKTRPMNPPPKPKPVSSRPIKQFKQFIHKRTPDIAPGVPSAAAQFLRRHYLSVHRCDIHMTETTSETWGDRHKLPNRGKGLYYVAGVGVVSELQLVNLALDKGFEIVEA